MTTSENLNTNNIGAGHDNYLKVLHIAAPRNSPWKPVAAEQLIGGLFTIAETFRLVIHSNSQSIDWSIESPEFQSDAIISAIYGLYSSAEVDISNKPQAIPGAYFYSLEGAAPFVGPLSTSQTLSQIDPLAHLLSAMSSVQDNEEIRLELNILPARSEQYKYGEKLRTVSMSSWWPMLATYTSVGNVGDMSSNANEQARHEAALQRLIESKLGSQLKEVQLTFKIRCSSRHRADSLINQIMPSLATFGRESSNFLVPSQPSSYGLVLTPGEVAALWHLPSDQCQVPTIIWASSSSSPLPRQLRGQNSGVILGVNKFQGTTHQVRLGYDDRVTHINIVGKTRVGKSTLLHNIIHQDIAAGKGVGVIDPHGQLVDSILSSSIPEEREEDIVLFDLSDYEYPVGLNFLSYPEGVSPGEVVGQTLSVIRKLFAKDWSATRMEDALHAALVASLAADDATIQTVPQIFYDSAYRSEILPNVEDLYALEFWYDDYESASVGLQREIARPITTRLRKFYRNEKLQPIVGQSGSLDFRAILDERKIFLAKIGGLSEVETETLGALLVSKFQIAAMSRGSEALEVYPEFYLHIDEVQRFVTTSLSQLLSEAGKFGMRMSVANQFLKQLEGDTLDAVMGNVGTSFIFRVGPKDAGAFGDFVKPQHSIEDLIDLDRFTAIVKMQQDGTTLPAFSLNTNKPVPEPINAAERVERIRELSRAKYARPRVEVETEMLQRFRRNRKHYTRKQGKEDYFG